jgi:hypothetical protein
MSIFPWVYERSWLCWINFTGLSVRNPSILERFCAKIKGIMNRRSEM